MTKEFTIAGANKSVRKIFSSYDEAVEHINKNKLFPSVNADHITITETVTTNHKFYSKKPVLSDHLKDMMVKSFKKAIKTYYTDPSICYISFSAAGLLYHHYRWQKKTPINDMAVEIVKEMMGISEKEMRDSFGGEIKNFNDRTRAEKWVSEHGGRIVLELIERILEKPELLKFLLVKTNYRPCNSVSMEVFDDNYSKIVLQIREKDTVIAGDYVYGRKVSLISVADLDDESLEKFKSSILER